MFKVFIQLLLYYYYYYSFCFVSTRVTSSFIPIFIRNKNMLIKAVQICIFLITCNTYSFSSINYSTTFNVSLLLYFVFVFYYCCHSMYSMHEIEIVKRNNSQNKNGFSISTILLFDCIADCHHIIIFNEICVLLS